MITVPKFNFVGKGKLMQTLKVEIFDEDVEEYPIDELAIEISESYRYDDYPAAHV